MGGPQVSDDRRRALLRAALRLLHRWLDTWNGIGLSQIADGEWRCYFMGENTLLAPQGYGVAPTPWRAVQRAAWAAILMRWPPRRRLG